MGSRRRHEWRRVVGHLVCLVLSMCRWDHDVSWSDWVVGVEVWLSAKTLALKRWVGVLSISGFCR